jgi:hypothetical protein
MLNFLLKDVPQLFFIKSKNSYLIMLPYRRKTYFTAICTLLKNSRHFVQNTQYFADLLRKILPVQTRAQTRYHIWTSFIHGGLFFIDAGHQRGTSFNRKFDMQTMIFL